jgi:hypothetical protein
MTEQTQHKRDSHLVVFWAWPLLIGLGLAVVLSVSIGGIVLIASGGELRTAGPVAGYTFFGVLGVATSADLDGGRTRAKRAHTACSTGRASFARMATSG